MREVGGIYNTYVRPCAITGDGTRELDGVIVGVIELGLYRSVVQSVRCQHRVALLQLLQTTITSICCNCTSLAPLRDPTFQTQIEGKH